jgi:sodium/potassium/calcium exchanger 2
MGLIRFTKASRKLPGPYRRKITFFSSLSIVLALVVFIVISELRRGPSFLEDDLQELQGHSRLLNATATTDTKKKKKDGSLYPDDLIFNKPYKDEPTGKKFACILHIIGILYLLQGINTVCDVYFAGAIDILVDVWKMQADVAGATFMAAGGSAPELCTSIIGANVATNDVGFGTIVGSAVFNVLFVIGLCGYVAKGDISLTWWPLFRDCTFYIISLGVLAAFTYGQVITIAEAIILFCMYLLYCVMMFFNQNLQAMAYRMVGTKSSAVKPDDKADDKADPQEVGASSKSAESTGVMENNFVDPEQTPERPKAAGGEDTKTEANSTAPSTVPPSPSLESGGNKDSGEKKELTAASDEEKKEGEGDGDDEDDEDDDFMKMPDDTVGRIIWGLCLPLYFAIKYTIPYPSERWYWASFLIALVWIAVCSFFLVWWVELVGKLFDLNEVVMGLTVLAAGTSIPDAVSSMAVARDGEADMAVSSSIGSNIFDILVGLPAGWIIKNISELSKGDDSWKGVPIVSPYLMFYTIVLLCMVGFVIVSIHFSGWQLSKKLGLMMAVLYGIFIVLCLLVELLKPEWLVTQQ